MLFSLRKWSLSVSTFTPITLGWGGGVTAKMCTIILKTALSLWNLDCDLLSFTFFLNMKTTTYLSRSWLLCSLQHTCTYTCWCNHYTWHHLHRDCCCIRQYLEIDNVMSHQADYIVYELWQSRLVNAARWLNLYDRFKFALQFASSRRAVFDNVLGKTIQGWVRNISPVKIVYWQLLIENPRINISAKLGTCLAYDSSEAVDTATGISVHIIYTCRTINTRVAIAFVNIWNSKMSCEVDMALIFLYRAPEFTAIRNAKA